MYVLVLDPFLDFSLEELANSERTPNPNVLILTILFAFLNDSILMSSQKLRTDDGCDR
jgi:hypothetical protein